MSKRKKKAFHFVDVVPDGCVCMNCHAVQLDTIKLNNCEHAICRPCFSKRTQNNIKCCPCSAPMEEGEKEDTLRLRSVIEGLTIFCPKQCGSKIALGHADTHMENACPLTKVACNNRGCYQKMKRKELNNHMKVCDFRMVTCEGCKRTLKSIELRKHQITMGCVNQKFKQAIVRQLRGSDRELKQYLTNIKQDTFKSMRDERTLEKEYMWRRIERNPDRYSPTLVRQCKNETHSVQSQRGQKAPHSAGGSRFADGICNRDSPLLVRSIERKVRSAEPQVCRRCKKTYTSRSNHDGACTWHKGVRYELCSFSHLVIFADTIIGEIRGRGGDIFNTKAI